ncbi:cytochrome P450 [Aspergillus costaricaensis CBS 115574]|uniref:Cytochrome P450 n=1 Tax=Aspergillus costaricaensis CBS 115574 TaxID=1448317 RepID=A0ACD1IW51_9EURO|nr:cytochrome P450 [Aspergillus costaricaensis CBS 115574]RAK94386.1 cytochrome P450 [Aspergillus costaricaensis CBS 115574]
MLSSLLSLLLLCVRRLRGWLYLIRGPELIDEAYVSAGGMPFKMPTPNNNHLMVTSSYHIKELINAPLQSLSLHAVAKEILQPKYTMSGFEWQDQRGIEGTGFVRALRSRLTAHLPGMLPDLKRMVEAAITEELSTPETDGMLTIKPGSVHCRLFPLIKRAVTKVNCFVFFGEQLAQNPEFTAAALEFPQTVIFASEILRITPSFLRHSVASLVTERHRAVKTLMRYLEPVVKQRLAMRAVDSTENVPVDCMQWLIETSPRKTQWTTARMVGEIIAVWFGSVHQLAMVCLCPDLAAMPLLDSFLRETIRCTNSDAITARRKALTPFTFSDGLRVDRGDWVCIPQRAMMRDPARYSHAEQFDGFRFARANKLLALNEGCADVPEVAPLQLTDVDVNWPIWGLGNTACPGRFYATTVLKLMMGCILQGWECRLADPQALRWRTWRSSVVPRTGTVVVFKRRQMESPTLVSGGGD